MITATSRQTIPKEWTDPIASNVGYIKPAFLEQVLEMAKKGSAAHFDRLRDRLENGVIKTPLTADQKQYLKENFDLKNMSWEDYQSLIGKLCEFGVLDQEDKDFLHCGFSGLQMIPVDLSGPTSTVSSYAAPVRDPSSYDSWKGDVLGWMKFLSSFQCWDSDSQSWRKTDQARLFGKVRELLDAIA